MNRLCAVLHSESLLAVICLSVQAWEASGRRRPPNRTRPSPTQRTTGAAEEGRRGGRESICAAAGAAAAAGDDGLRCQRSALQADARDCTTRAKQPMGIKHLAAAEEARRVSARHDDPDDPKVQKTLGQLGLPSNSREDAEAVQMVIAQLAFANSDLAFEGNHLFQGNFYGMNIFDISDPASLPVTSMVCPGGQGDVSVYKNLLFMSVEMPNGRLDCGDAGISAGAAANARGDKEKKHRLPAAQAGPFPRR